MDKIIELGNGYGEVTVGELISMLENVPSNWTVSFCGESCPGIFYDESNSHILFDDIDFLKNEYGDGV